jgi:hypothetical protein
LQLSLSDAVALNSTDILFSQLPILGNLNFLQEGKAFFDDVSDNILILSSFCASVRDLSHQNDAFFGRLTLLAPVGASCRVLERSTHDPGTVRGLCGILVPASNERRGPISQVVDGGRVRVWGRLSAMNTLPSSPDAARQNSKHNECRLSP